MKEIDVIAINTGLGWMLTIFEPHLYKEWDKKDNYFISKLLNHRAKLDNNINGYFSDDKVNELKKIIDRFIEANKKFQETTGLKNYFCGFLMEKRAKNIFNKISELLSESKIKNELTN